MKKAFEYLMTTCVYVAFYGMIAASVWWTKSAWPLLALVFSPSIKTGKAAHPDCTCNDD